MVPPRKTKIYATKSGPGSLSGPGNLYRLLNPNSDPDGTGEKRKIYYQSKSTTSWFAKEKARVITKLKFTLELGPFFKVHIML